MLVYLRFTVEGLDCGTHSLNSFRLGLFILNFDGLYFLDLIFLAPPRSEVLGLQKLLIEDINDVIY